MLRYTWTCRCCGKPQEGLPLAWGSPVPVPYDDLPEGERATRAVIDNDVCIIDEREFYIRGLIELPIVGRPDTFCWIVWCSLSKASFDRMVDIWEKPNRETEPPFFGWLASALHYEPGTLGLKTRVHMRPRGQAPFVELEPTGHPLAVEQREGITLEHVIAVAERNLGH